MGKVVQPSDIRNIVVAVVGLAALGAAGEAATQSVNIGGQTCSNNYSLYDYFSDGKYIGSSWEVDGVSCISMPGSGYDDGGYFDGSLPGGPGDGSTLACRSTDPTTAKDYADALSVLAATAIRARTDYQSREYGAIIHRDATGAIRVTALTESTAVSVSFNYTALGVNQASIIGIVHNHPQNSYNSSAQELQINLNPSPTDWNTAATIVGNAASADLMQLFVVGTDGVLREFSYNNRSSYEPRRTPGGGYGVTPGDVVPTTLVASPCL